MNRLTERTESAFKANVGSIGGGRWTGEPPGLGERETSVDI